MVMTSSRPYLVRAFYEWIVDNGCTPYILVDAFASGVEVPQDYVKDGRIVLNISPTAVQHLDIGDKAINFEGRFAGIGTTVFAPIASVLGIYAKENSQGMIFETEQAPEPPEPPFPPVSVSDNGIGGGNKPRSGKTDKPRPSLKVVK